MKKKVKSHRKVHSDIKLIYVLASALFVAFIAIVISAALPYSNPQAKRQQPTGVCMIRDFYTGVPNFYDKDVTSGYAKLAVPGINSIAELKTACGAAQYTELKTMYCKNKTSGNSYQQQILTYGSDGGWTELTCPGDSCITDTCN